jgi:hypothetical protein
MAYLPAMGMVEHPWLDWRCKRLPKCAAAGMVEAEPTLLPVTCYRYGSVTGSMV